MEFLRSGHPGIKPGKFILKKATRWWPFLIGETLSSFGSSASEHLAAIGNCHSLAEPVFLFTVPFLWLIGTKHRHPSFGQSAHSLGADRTLQAELFTDHLSASFHYIPTDGEKSIYFSFICCIVYNIIEINGLNRLK